MRRSSYILGQNEDRLCELLKAIVKTSVFTLSEMGSH